MNTAATPPALRRRRGVASHRMLGLIIVLCLVLVAPRGTSAQRAVASFVDAGTLNLVTDQFATDIDPATNEFNGSDMVEGVS